MDALGGQCSTVVGLLVGCTTHRQLWHALAGGAGCGAGHSRMLQSLWCDDRASYVYFYIVLPHRAAGAPETRLARAQATKSYHLMCWLPRTPLLVHLAAPCRLPARAAIQ